MLLSAEELHQQLSQAAGQGTDQEGHLVIFDCRFNLSDPTWGQRLYNESHIPSAHYLDLERDMSSRPTNHGGRHPLPDVAQFAERIGQAGVTKHSTVVVYDGGEGMATRAWWLLRYVGIGDVRVLNGGYAAWQDKGYVTTAKVPERLHGQIDPQVQSGWTVGVEDVVRMVNGEMDGVLVDARAGERYSGEVEPIDAVAGHIPGAVNAPWLEGVGKDGAWKQPEQQRARFHDLLQQDGPIVVYCGSGVTACADIFALKLAGVEDVRLYPGSWSDWITYSDHPVEKSR